MKLRYDNEQNPADPMNGAEIADGGRLAALLDARRRQPPFLARLSGENGFELMIGIGRNVGCAQHSRSNGDLPYLMAVSPNPPLKSGGVEFLTANTPTPIPARNILRFDELREIAVHFLETGERSSSVAWESVGAVKRDWRGPMRPRPYQHVLRFLLERWHNPHDDTNAKFAARMRARPDWRSGQPVEVCYLNHQDTHDPMNGSVLRRSDELAELLDERRKDAPFVAQLLADNGLKLVLGIGSGVGFIQFRRIDGDLPYYMARSPRRWVKSKHVAFRIDNVPVPFPRRYVLNSDDVAQIAQYFLATGERSDAFSWESI